MHLNTILVLWIINIIHNIQLTKERHPRLKIVRNAKEKKHKHFGPFPDAQLPEKRINF